MGEIGGLRQAPQRPGQHRREAQAHQQAQQRQRTQLRATAHGNRAPPAMQELGAQGAYPGMHQPEAHRRDQQHRHRRPPHQRLDHQAHAVAIDMARHEHDQRDQCRPGREHEQRLRPLPQRVAQLVGGGERLLAHPGMEDGVAHANPGQYRHPAGAAWVEGWVDARGDGQPARPRAADQSKALAKIGSIGARRNSSSGAAGSKFGNAT